MGDKFILTDAEWRARLSPEAYDVLRRHGTERPFSGCFLGSHDAGTGRGRHAPRGGIASLEAPRVARRLPLPSPCSTLD